LFLHRIFGYRSVILFPWLARVFDRCEGRSNGLPPLPKSPQSNIHEIRARSVTYYQVLIDTRDMPHIRAQTGLINFIRIKFKKQISMFLEAVTFLGNQERDRNLYAIPGLDYVAHEDVIPYTVIDF
jgi:polymerase delta-interacting protein 2